jgi:hypothetical protein
MSYTNKPKLRECELKREIVTSAAKGDHAFVGTAMAMKIAGEEVIVIGRNIASLDIVFNYVEARHAKGNTYLMNTLRTDACPEVAIMSKASLTFDDEL